ncbi:hypothetical protein FGI33_01290 [Clavibacter phaseoli]|nr:hypothetical protein DZF99_11805 [Clavibacter phaseoli]UKF29883.1 hypothetical protein FGD69_01910 [Clavibacter phaseoli]UKF35801.1 hypothetical protein FGI33_01290 [Clavibacter phaseoli]
MHDYRAGHHRVRRRCPDVGDARPRAHARAARRLPRHQRGGRAQPAARGPALVGSASCRGDDRVDAVRRADLGPPRPGLRRRSACRWAGRARHAVSATRCARGSAVVRRR